MAKRVLFLIRSLEIGGAERQLVATAVSLHQRGAEVHVATFYPGGVLRKELQEAGIAVADLGKRGRWDVIPFAFRLVRTLRHEQPTLIYSFLPVANIMSVLARPFVRRAKIVWGVRASNVDLDHYDWLSRYAAWIEAKLARFSDHIVCNSEAGRAHHTRLGYPEDRMLVIPNGIDTDRFRFDSKGRKRVRADWWVADNEILIGLAGRLDPMKDHPTFLRAVALLAKIRPDVRFVCVGEGPDDYCKVLRDEAGQLGIADRTIWTAARNDMPAVYSAFDVAASSSAYGEGFSNVIAEAMACERPCAVTDVGDSACIVGDTGRVVAPGDPKALADALVTFVDMRPEERLTLGRAARKRVETEFGVDRMVERTGDLLGL